MKHSQIEFTYDFYQQLIDICIRGDYHFGDFQTIPREKCIVLRHDVDFSPQKAHEFASLEHRLGVTSTYFFLIRSNFYNVLSRDNIQIIKAIANMGHAIGLHFDEKGTDPDNAPASIQRECGLLSEIAGVPVSSFSYHRPSPIILNRNLNIAGLANAYADAFFTGVKYLSDSRCHWKENPIETVASGQHDRLQILTHPIWYASQDNALPKTLASFCFRAAKERHRELEDNIRNLSDDLPPEFLGDIDEGYIHNAIRLFREKGCETERLRMKILSREDAEDMFAYTSDAETCKFLKWGPHTNVQQAEAFINRILSRQKDTWDIHWGIYSKADNKLIGVIRVYKPTLEERSVDLSYILNPHYTGKGLMTECVASVIDFCHRELGASRVYADFSEGNAASQKVMVKCGMVPLDEMLNTYIETKGILRKRYRYVKEVKT